MAVKASLASLTVVQRSLKACCCFGSKLSYKSGKLKHSSDVSL